MKPDDFEKTLSSQPLKQVPGEWRAQILSAAREQKAIHHSSLVIRHSPLSTLKHQLVALLWPHPKAWAGLAAVWVCIVALNLSEQEKPAMLAKASPPPSPEMVAELRQQQRMLAELIGTSEVRVADRQRVLTPKPRSAREDMLAV